MLAGMASGPHSLAGPRARAGGRGAAATATGRLRVRIDRRIPVPILATIAGLLAVSLAAVAWSTATGDATATVLLRLLESALVVLAAVGALRRRRTAATPVERAGWTSLVGAAVAVLVTTVAAMLAPHLDVRLGAPTPLDLPSRLVAPRVLLGVLLFARPTRSAAHLGRIVLDAIAVGCAVGIVGWYLVVRPFVDARLAAQPSQELALAYVAGDAIALGLGLLALLRAKRRLRGTVACAALGLAALLASDLGRGFEVLPGVAPPASVTEIGWALAMALLAIAAWLRPGPRGERVALSDARARRAWLWWLALPYLFLMPVAGVLLVGAVAGDVDGPMIAGSAVVIAVLGFRHVVALRENAELAQRLAGSVRELEHRAAHDELTGLLNRGGLISALRGDSPIAGRPAALLFVDLDRFKAINDTLGHAVGDAVLRAVGERLRFAVRAGLAARFAGDEFVLVLPGVVDEHAALGRAQEVIELVERPIPLADGGEVVVTASVGLTTTSSLADGETIVREADLAMFEAKQGGRARVQVFEEGLRERSADRVRLEQDLRRALTREDEIEVHLQPLIALEGDRLWGAEALVRWRHPERGMLAPGRFLAIAEESGLIVPLGHRVLSEACAAAAAVPDLIVSVNLSARQLHDPLLLATVRDALTAHGLAPERLCLEVVEDVLVDDRTIGVLEALRALGARVAIDDFGVGASSLKQLRRIPGALVKIDRSFIGSLDTAEAGDDDRVMVRALVNVAEQLGLQVVAEGIERPDQLSAVRDLGVTIGQGWLLGHPQRAAAFVTSCGGGPLVRRGPRPARRSAA